MPDLVTQQQAGIGAQPGHGGAKGDVCRVRAVEQQQPAGGGGQAQQPVQQRHPVALQALAHVVVVGHLVAASAP